MSINHIKSGQPWAAWQVTEVSNTHFQNNPHLFQKQYIKEILDLCVHRLHKQFDNQLVLCNQPTTPIGFEVLSKVIEHHCSHFTAGTAERENSDALSEVS